MVNRKYTLYFRLLTFAFLCVIFFVQFGATQSESKSPEKEILLISPYGAVARSAIIPGWGQFHAHNYLQSVFSFFGVGTSLAGAVVTHFSFREAYDKEYLPIALENRKSKEALAAYDWANQKYRVRQFFLYTAAGIWAYSIIDAYVAANLYNASTKSQLIIEDSKAFEQLGVKFDLNQDHISFNLLKQF